MQDKNTMTKRRSIVTFEQSILANIDIITAAV